MEGTTILYASLSFVFLVICLKLLFPSKNLPPSPPSLPILGHLHLLKPPVHRFYHSLSQKYGPVFSLRLGSRLVVVVSSSTLAEECFTKNDVLLANRPKLIMGKHFGYNYTTVSTSSYGDHWRNLRRLGAIEIFSSSRLNAFASVRKDEVRRLLVKLSRDSRQGFAKVELKSMLTDLTFNNIMRMVAGKRYYGDEVTNEDEAKEFREVIAETFRNGGAATPADFLPAVNWLGGFEKKVKKLGKKLDGLLQKLIDEHRWRRTCPGAGLAQRVVGLTLGALNQCFEWGRVDDKEIDMAEGAGSTMPKAYPLEALCRARPIVNKAFYS
ncbi:hypothetical protein V6N13_131645 [Hibiscus sabdariffa]